MLVAYEIDTLSLQNARDGNPLEMPLKARRVNRAATDGRLARETQGSE